MKQRSFSLAGAFAEFQQHWSLSPSSVETYAQAMKYFFAFLRESPLAKALSVAGRNPEARSLQALGSHRADAEILLRFTNYLALSARNGRLAASTSRLYTHAMISWFEFMAEEMLLPKAFPSGLALSLARRRLDTVFPPPMSLRTHPDPPVGMELLIHVFDHAEVDRLCPPKEQYRQKLESLRNRALIYALASSGGRISEVLRLEAKDIRGAQIGEEGVWSAVVRGNGHESPRRPVALRFTPPALRAMQEYLESQQDPLAKELFVSHARTRPASRGKPLTANAAWRIVRKAAQDLGMSGIHPHVFRHWRATQMLRQGVPIEQVQGYLNHRNIQTTRLYAKAVERTVERAAAMTDPLQR